MDAFTIVLIIAMVAIFYFLVLRPNKKRQEDQKRTINELTEGTTVLLQNGFYATFIRREGDNAVVELSEGEEVLVLNQLIARPTPDVKLPHQIDDEGWPTLDQGLHDDLQVPDDASSLADPVNSDESLDSDEPDDLDRRLDAAAAESDAASTTEGENDADDNPGDPEADPKKN